MSKNKNLSVNTPRANSSAVYVQQAALAAQIGEWLTARRIYHEPLSGGEKIHSGETKTLACFAVVCGQIVFIETKPTGEKTTVAQTAIRAARTDSGAIIIVCDLFDEFVCKFSAIRAAIEEIARKGEFYD